MNQCHGTRGSYKPSVILDFTHPKENCPHNIIDMRLHSKIRIHDYSQIFHMRSRSDYARANMKIRGLGDLTIL